MSGYTFIFDAYIESLVFSFQSKTLTQIMLFVSTLVGPQILPIFAVLVSVALIFKKHLAHAVIFAASLSLGVVSNVAIKTFMKIDRPIFTSIDVFGWSYPSGHTTVATVILALVAIFLTNTAHGAYKLSIWLGALVSISAVALSRVYLGAHFFSDTLGGVFLGLAIVFLSLVLLRRLQSVE